MTPGGRGGFTAFNPYWKEDLEGDPEKIFLHLTPFRRRLRLMESPPALNWDVCTCCFFHWVEIRKGGE